MGDSDVTSFKLIIRSGFFRRIKAGLLDKWLGFAVENKVKEMYLSIGQENFEESNSYCLPKILDNARYLTILELDRVKLDSSHSFTFPYLKTLSLERIHQSDASKDDVVFKFLLGCSCLEKLRLHRYKFLNIDGKLPLQSLSLKFLEVKDSANVDGLKVEAINLESLVITGTSVYNMIHSACKKIRNLSLDDTSYDFELLLRTLIDNNPLLENLTLSTCYTYDFLFKISGEHLKSFNFKNRCLFESKITIESTPKLAYFCYEGTIDLSLSIEPSNSLSGKIVIHEGGHYVFCGYDAAWFTDMLNFLLNLNCSWNIVSLHASRCQALIWPENLKRVCRSPLLNWKHLRVITKDSDPERISDLKDSMMWISPSLETLSINKMQIF
ncbi:hypothetical protein CsatB_028000 [Cannabis sativa]